MNENYSLITSIATAFGLALPFGFVAERWLRSPALVGYILAGLAAVIIPTLRPVDDSSLQQLADIGVMLLMFGVGLRFSLSDLRLVRSVAVPGALVQMTLTAALGYALGRWGLGMDWSAALVLGMAVSTASTVVVTKALDVAGLSSGMSAQAAVGWLVIQDLVSVLILLVLPVIAEIAAGTGPVDWQALSWELGRTLAGAALFVFLMLGAGRRILPRLLRLVAVEGSRELFTLAVLSSAILIACAASALFDLSFALGAFFAGMVMRGSSFAHRAAKDALPLQDAFSALFFVAIGMMLDGRVFLESPGAVAGVVLLALLFTTTVSALLVVLLRWPLRTALLVAACLGQTGEFGFIVVSQGIALDLVPRSLMSVVVAASVILIALNPLLFAALPKIEARLRLRFAWARRAAARSLPHEGLSDEARKQFLGGHVIVAGADPAQRDMLAALHLAGRSVVAVVSADAPVEDLKAQGFAVLVGPAADPAVLRLAGIDKAALLVLPFHDMAAAWETECAARELRPDIETVTLVRTLEETRMYDVRNPKFSVLCEDVLSSLVVTDAVMQKLLRPEEDAELQQEKRARLGELLGRVYASRVDTQAQEAAPRPATLAELERQIQEAARTPDRPRRVNPRRAGRKVGSILGRILHPGRKH